MKNLGLSLQTKGKILPVKTIVSFTFTGIKGRCREQDLKKENETQAAKRSQRWNREKRLWISWKKARERLAVPQCRCGMAGSKLVSTSHPPLTHTHKFLAQGWWRGIMLSCGTRQSGVSGWDWLHSGWSLTHRWAFRKELPGCPYAEGSN